MDKKIKLDDIFLDMDAIEAKEYSYEEYADDVKGLASRYGKGSQDGIKDALNIAQEEFGCAEIRCQNIIAEAFEVELKLVKTLIKFNKNITESKVEYEVVCCTGERCRNNGSFEVLKAIRKELGIDFDETTPDGLVLLRTQNCFRQCGKGPNIRVNGKFHHKMTAEKVKDLVEELKK